MRIIEYTKGHYETQDVEFGRVYKWYPESVTIECEECGNRAAHTRSSLIESPITCECGKDDTAHIRKELVFQVLEEDEPLHPWRNWNSSETTGIPI